MHCLRNLASALIEQEVVKIENDIKVLTGDDIKLSGDRNLLDEIWAWEESNKQNKENKPINSLRFCIFISLHSHSKYKFHTSSQRQY